MKENWPKWPIFTQEEIEVASRVLRSGKVNYWTGEEGKAFEREFAEHIGSDYGVALANGSLALDLALTVLDIGPGDEVVVSPRSFIASASCVALRGARPVFADVDPNTGNVTAESIKAVLTEKTKAVIPVHLGGIPCEMEEIMEISNQSELFVIEDCAQAHGARLNGRHVGTFGHIGAFSFCQDKIISTGGEGGMVVTDNKELWAKMWSFKDHGKNYQTVFERKHPPGFRWLHESFGTNLRMTEVQSAIGRIQLVNLDKMVASRRNNARILEQGLSRHTFLRIPAVHSSTLASYYRFYVYVVDGQLNEKWNRDRLMNEISEKGVPCMSGSCSEIYLEKAFANGDFRVDGYLRNARKLGETCLMFPVYSTLGEKHMERILDAVDAAAAKME